MKIRKKTNGDISTRRNALVKAHFLQGNPAISNVKPTETELRNQDIFRNHGTLPAPYVAETLIKIFEHSNALRQNIDAYAFNIDGQGHTFKPIIDLDSDDAEDQISISLFLEKAHKNGSIKGIDLPSDKEVAEKKKEIEKEILVEKSILKTFFDSCCPDRSFPSLRKETRQDTEVTGNAYWEVIRNAKGIIAEINLIPCWTVRLLPLQEKNESVEIREKFKDTQFSYSHRKVNRRFRKFVQVFNNITVWFKQLGDPRIMSSATGKYYQTVENLQKAEPGVAPATEIWHHRIPTSRSPYGIPRWIGSLISVLGSREAEEVNLLYFQNKSVPPMAILVSGGRLNEESIHRIENYIENQIRGKKNFHKIMVLEAEPAEIGAALDSGTGRIKMQLIPLTSAQHNDALFQKYDERNIDKVGMQFRLPRLLRGDIRDFNRGTADAAIAFAEVQVFAPIRDEFDWLINKILLPELDIKYHVFRSNSPITRDPEKLAQMIAKLAEQVLTPEEARDLAEDVFNKPFNKLDTTWTKIPQKLLIEGITPETTSEDIDEARRALKQVRQGKVQTQTSQDASEQNADKKSSNKEEPKNNKETKEKG